MDRTLLPGELVSQMFERHTLMSGELSNRSYGWVLADIDGQTVPMVAGSDWNGSSALWIQPDDRFAIAVSTNLGFEQPRDPLEGLARLWEHLPKK